MKAEYIEKIERLLQKCDDISMLDLIFQLLQKKRKRKNGLTMTAREKAIQYITTMTDQEAKEISSFLASFNYDISAALEHLKKERGIAE